MPQQPPSVGRAFVAGSERNYFLESLPAALAIAMGGRLIRANEAFLYAFGFASESELRKAGGLAVLFPESHNGILMAGSSSESTREMRRMAGRSGRSQTITVWGVSRSGRKRRIPIAFRNVSTGRDPVQIMILHEDALYHESNAGADREPGGRKKQDTCSVDDREGRRDSLDFLASVSHEVRTPLNSIIGFSELMKDERFGVVDDEKFRGYAKDIHTSAMHALSLINDLLDITKIIAGKPELDFEAVDLNEIIADSLSCMRTQAKRRQITLKSLPGKKLPALYADRRSLKQILLNLLSNGIKFTPPGGQVRISSQRQTDGGILLKIVDTGIGMRRDQIGTAMEPFGQIDEQPDERREKNGQRQTGKRNGLPDHEKGTGLGLPLTRALVNAHQASFEIDSVPGKGTSVEIRFPPEQMAGNGE